MAHRLALAILLAGLSSLGLGSPASAHAQLVSSSPGSGEVLAEAPTEVRLVFSEPADPAYAGLDLLDGGGATVASDIGHPDAADPRVLVAEPPPLADGLYTVNWHVLSAADGHITQGFITFGVGNVEVPGVAAEPGIGRLHPGQSPSAAFLDATSRFAGYGGAMLGFGLPIIGLVVIGPTLGRWPRRLGSIVSGALLAAALGTLLAVTIAAAGLGEAGGPLDYALGTRTGQLLAARTLAAALGSALVWLAFVSGRPRAGLAIGGTAAAGCLLLTALGSHAAASGSGAPIVADLAHLAGAGTWLAGLLGLLLVAVGLLGESRRDALRFAVPRFSALALVSIGLVAATGLYAGWLQVGSVDGVGTEYGLLLAAKVAVVAAALTLGGINFLDGGRGLAIAGGLRRRIGLELGLAGLVVVLTANLTSGSPPAQVRTVEVPAVSGSAGLRLAFQPGEPGPNRAVVSAPQPGIHAGTVELQLARLDAATGSTRIQMRLDASAPHGTRFVADGVLLPSGSRWDATARILDDDGDEFARQRFPFEVGPEGLSVARGLRVDLGTLIGAGVLLVALGALGFWLGGGSLPRTAPGVGRVALLFGGLAGVALGAILLAWAPAA